MRHPGQHRSMQRDQQSPRPRLDRSQLYRRWVLATLYRCCSYWDCLRPVRHYFCSSLPPSLSTDSFGKSLESLPRLRSSADRQMASNSSSEACTILAFSPMNKEKSWTMNTFGNIHKTSTMTIDKPLSSPGSLREDWTSWALRTQRRSGIERQ